MNRRRFLTLSGVSLLAAFPLPAAAVAKTRKKGASMATHDVLEGDLQPMTNADQGKLLGKYFVHIPAESAGKRDGIGFTLLMLGQIPTTVLTAAERVKIVIEDDRVVPWASVELGTGLFHTTLKISREELKNVPILAVSKTH